MPTSAVIEFVRAAGPIAAPVTKFGGEPCWLDKPRWPQSRKLGVPMSFLCQIALADVPDLPASLLAGSRMAYVFMTEPEDGEVVSTWEPEGGENAVIIQPGGSGVPASTLEATTYAQARAACGLREESEDQPVREDLAVRLTTQEEPEFIDPQTGLLGFTINPATAHVEEETLRKLWSNKLGGVPSFWQGCEYPTDGRVWLPILQLNDYDELFSANFGTGRAFVFVSADRTEGRLLWQC